MKELNVKYHSDKDYRELFKTMRVFFTALMRRNFVHF